MHNSNCGGNSLLDRFCASRKKHFENPNLIYDKLEHQKGYFQSNHSRHADAEDTTIVFPPWNTSIEEAKKYKFIPQHGKIIVFTTPGGFVNCDPKKTKQIFLNVIRDAKSEIEKILAKSPNQKINVVSYSAANGAGFYTVNNLIPKKNKGNFISVATGRGLGEEIFASPILRKIKDDAIKIGISNGDEYNKVFYDKEWGLLLPIYNCDNLPDSTTFFIGNKDTFIPTAFGLDMASRARRSNPNVKLHRYPFGHIGTMLCTAYIENLKRYWKLWNIF